MKHFTIFLSAMLLFIGVTTASAQSQIPGSLDLSTAVVDAGTGTLHDGAGWDGSKIDWITKGNTVTIKFENTKDGAKYKIISYGGTNQSQVVVGFSILDAKGNLFYDETTEPYSTGGFGDKKKNNSLPVTDPMPAGQYELTLYYDNLTEGESLTVNIAQIDFIDADEYVEDTPSAGLGLNIPCTLDGSKAIITKNCSWGSTPSCDDDNCFNWIGDGDVISFPIVNTKESAYAITFDTATPCEPVTIDFLITDANGNTVYGHTVNVVCTGESGGDWAFKPEGHNTSLPNTDVLQKGNYTLSLTFHQGTNYENFTTNVKDIVFTAVGSGDSFDIDLSTVDTSASQGNKTLHYMADGDENCPRLDYPSAGDIAKFKFTTITDKAYKITFNYATPMTGMFMTWIIEDANGKEVYNELFNIEPTGAPSDFWTIYKDYEYVPETPVLPAGEYTLIMKYNIDKDGNIVPGYYDGSENGAFHINIRSITFTAITAPVNVPCVTLSGDNFNKEASTNDLYQFNDADGFTLQMNNRDVNKTPCNWNGYTGGINIKNNDPASLIIPAGKKVYALEIGGVSQSDAGNLCYLYLVDKDDINFFTDGIGQDVKENATIESSAIYPMYADTTAPRVALLDFTAAPAEKSIKFIFSGNNQEDFWLKIYTTEADANAVLGKGTVETSDIYAWEAGAEKGGKATAADADGNDTTGDDINMSTAGYNVIRLRGAKDFSTFTVTITLDKELEAGDQLSVTAFRNKNQADKQSGFLTKFDKGGEINSATTGLEFVNIHADAPDDQNFGTEPNTLTFDIPAEAAGSKVITLTRAATATNLFITKFMITRGGQTTGISEVKTVRIATDAIYNLRGQRVDENYKGLVIKNGRKYLQK